MAENEKGQSSDSLQIFEIRGNYEVRGMTGSRSEKLKKGDHILCDSVGRRTDDTDRQQSICPTVSRFHLFQGERKRRSRGGGGSHQIQDTQNAKQIDSISFQRPVQWNKRVGLRYGTLPPSVLEQDPSLCSAVISRGAGERCPTPLGSESHTWRLPCSSARPVPQITNKQVRRMVTR